MADAFRVGATEPFISPSIAGERLSNLSVMWFWGTFSDIRGDLACVSNQETLADSCKKVRLTYFTSLIENHKLLTPLKPATDWHA